jgi:hypothetical protein
MPGSETMTRCGSSSRPTAARWGTLGKDGWEVSRWSVRDGRLVIDRETNPIRRAVRPVALRLGVRTEPVETYYLAWLTADELTMGHYNGHVTELIRAPAH